MNDKELALAAEKLPPKYRLQRHTLAVKGKELFTNTYIENSARLAIGKVRDDGSAEFFGQAAGGDVTAFIRAGWAVR